MFKQKAIFNKPTDKDNYMKLEFSARSENEPFARNVAAAFASQLDPTLSELNDVKTAVSEAVTNSIVHGYERKGGIVTLECALSSGQLHITVSDLGKGIDDVNRAVEPFYTTLEDEERSGMGFAIMKAFSDEFSLTSSLGAGTTVYMKKLINKNGTAEC